jgi:hypothetical protein
MMRAWLVLLAMALPASATPSFEDFAVPAWHGPRAAAVVLGSENARRYRTRLKGAFEEGPNFAGRFTIVIWGCGTSCAVLAVIDQGTGEVFFSPAVAFGDWAMWETEDYGFHYQTGSRLLELSGCINGTDHCGRHYYEWSGSDFRLVNFEPLARGAQR